MQFQNSVTLFQHLLSLDEDNMRENLANLIDETHVFYAEIIGYIEAHIKNKSNTVFKSLINGQATTLVDDDVIHSLLDKQVGHYKLTKKLGQGGMGAVYLGERNDGQLEQKVAIKFVYPSIVALAGEDFLHKEAQHLANLDHVNIAKIFTIDTTEDALPYMVMEYVDGIPIDQYCDENKLDLNARLKLFQKVCRAVHEAHQNMIIHADIKPSNILVDHHGEPKLMDFGIARNVNKVVEDNKAGAEFNTRYVKAVSIDFASPEQVEGRFLTTSCDIYAVGKTLERSISTFNKEFNSLKNKAMQKHANERYQSILHLGNDINALIEDRPLQAHLSYFYSFKKLLIRNQVISALSFLVCLSVIAFIGWQYQQKLILNKEIRLKETTLSYINKIFSYADPNISAKRDLSAKDLLNSALNNLNNSELTDEKIKASIFNMIGGAFYGLSSYKESKMAFEQSMMLLNSSSQKDSPAYVEAINNLAGVERALGNINQAKKLYSSVLNLYENAPQNKRSIYLNNIARIMFDDKDYVKAVNTFKKALLIDTEIYGLNHPQVAIRHSNIGSVYQKMKHFDLAIKYIQIAIKIDMINYGEQHPNIAVSYNKLGSIYRELNQLQRSVDYIEKALKIGKETIGTEHHYFGIFTFNYAKTLIMLNMNKKGMVELNKAISILKSKLGENHPAYIKALRFKEVL